MIAELFITAALLVILFSILLAIRTRVRFVNAIFTKVLRIFRFLPASWEGKIVILIEIVILAALLAYTIVMFIQIFQREGKTISTMWKDLSPDDYNYSNPSAIICPNKGTFSNGKAKLITNSPLSSKDLLLKEIAVKDIPSTKILSQTFGLSQETNCFQLPRQVNWYPENEFAVIELTMDTQNCDYGIFGLLNYCPEMYPPSGNFLWHAHPVAIGHSHELFQWTEHQRSEAGTKSYLYQTTSTIQIANTPNTIKLTIYPQNFDVIRSRFYNPVSILGVIGSVAGVVALLGKIRGGILGEQSELRDKGLIRAVFLKEEDENKSINPDEDGL